MPEKSSVRVQVTPHGEVAFIVVNGRMYITTSVLCPTEGFAHTVQAPLDLDVEGRLYQLLEAHLKDV